jgi:cytoskeletal protein RodZ
MAKGTFGERLKRERELREVTPEEVCKATRIAPRFLEALENEQWDRLPGGVFGRGFVRSIARYLGLSEEDLLSEYDLARGESGNGALAKAEERIPVPPKWIPILAGVLAVSVLVALALGGRYAWKAYQAHRAAKKTSAIVSIPRGTQPRTIGVSAPAGAEPGMIASTTNLDLSVSAKAPTHVRVVADGTVTLDTEMAARENRHFAATDRFEVTAADSAAVLLELNGQSVPFAGATSSSSTIVLTSNDTRQARSGTTQR